MRARSDDLMLGRVTYDGLFYQLDTESGRYEELVYGRGWEGPSLNYRRSRRSSVTRSSAPGSRTRSPNASCARISRATSSSIAPSSCRRARAAEQPPWHQDGGAFWGLAAIPSFRCGPPSTMPLGMPVASRSSRARTAGSPPPSVASFHAKIVDARNVESSVVALPARAGEAILIPQLRMAPVWREHDGPSPPRPHGLLHAGHDEVPAKTPRAPPVSSSLHAGIARHPLERRDRRGIPWERGANS